MRFELLHTSGLRTHITFSHNAERFTYTARAGETLLTTVARNKMLTVSNKKLHSSLFIISYEGKNFFIKLLNSDVCCLFVAFAVHFAPYLRDLSSMLLT